MIGMAARVVVSTPIVKEAATVATATVIRYAAFKIRKHIRDSIKTSEKAAEPGKPISTRGRIGNVRNAIYAAIEKTDAIIGPRYSFVGDSMNAHEFGNTRYGKRYRARPTMRPALESNYDMFVESFRGSIGQ
jgi:hypothetical protein